MRRARGAVRWPRNRVAHPGVYFDLAPDGGGPFISSLQSRSRVHSKKKVWAAPFVSVNRPKGVWLGAADGHVVGTALRVVSTNGCTWIASASDHCPINCIFIVHAQTSNNIDTPFSHGRRNSLYILVHT